MRKFKAITVIIMIISIIFSGVVTAKAETGRLFSLELDGTYCQSESRKMLSLINDFRTGGKAWFWDSSDSEKIQCGVVGELEYDYELEKIAMQRAIEVAVSFSHIRTDGTGCFTAYENYNSYSCGENICAGVGTYNSAYNLWLEDDYGYFGQGHRRNMLNSNFNRIGIACVFFNGIPYWVQELASSEEPVTYTEPVNTTVKTNVVLNEDLIKDVGLASPTEIKADLTKTVKPDFKLSMYFAEHWPPYYFEVPVKPEYVSIADTSIATADNNFNIKGLKTGSTTAYFNLLNKTYSVPLLVKTEITLKTKSLSLYRKGKGSISYSIKNKVGNVTFASSNSKVAKVSSSGVVTALKSGTAYISVNNNGVVKKLKVTVKNPKLNKTSLTLKKGKTYTLKITGKVGTAKFTSSNKKVASVNSKGKIVAKKKGTATVTVVTNGVKLKCKVKVK